MSKISVIIPTYKTPEYMLRRCLDSLKGQEGVQTDDSSFLEVLVIDDNYEQSVSVENLVKEYPENFHYIYEEHGGVSHARNIGLDRAKGDYVTFVDADDYILPSTLRKTYDIVRNWHAIDMVIFGMKRLDEYGNNTGDFPLIDTRSGEGKCLGRAGDENIVENLAKSLYVPDNRVYKGYTGQTCAQLISRKLIGDTRFDTALKRSEDIVFDLEILRKVREDGIVILNERLYIYPANEDSNTHRYWNNMWDVMKPLVSRMDNFVGDIGITRYDADYRFVYSYYTILKQEIFYRLNDPDCEITEDTRKKKFKELVSDKVFYKRMWGISIRRIGANLKFFAALVLFAIMKSYKLTKWIWEVYNPS